MVKAQGAGNSSARGGAPAAAGISGTKIGKVLGKAAAGGAGGSLGVGQTQIRVLSLKQLKDLIADMYAQKIKYD